MLLIKSPKKGWWYFQDIVIVDVVIDCADLEKK